MAEEEHTSTARAERAFANAEFGANAEATSLRLAWKGSARPEREAWRIAFEVQRALLDGGAIAADLGCPLPDGAPTALGRICEGMSRLAITQWDPAAVEMWVERWDEIPVQGAATVSRRLAHAWHGWLRAPTAVDLEALQLLSVAARKAKQASVVVEAQALLALASLSRGQLEFATRAARRASRMARTEGLRYAEVLANLTLARVRRYQNAPHLALHILGALAGHAPASWHGWIAWEATLCGCTLDAHTTGTLLERASAALGDFVRALRDGSVELGPAVARLRDATNDNAVLAMGVRCVIAVFNTSEFSNNDATHAWQTARADQPPPGTAGLVFLESGDTAAAHIYLPRDTAARRFPAVLTSRLARSTGAHMLTDGTKPHSRLDTGLAVLAFGGSHGFAADAYFERVYGYAFDRDIHLQVLNTHLRRLRVRLGDAGEILRQGGRVRLHPSRSLILRDPRSRESIAQRALRVLASGGRQSAKELARHLRVPLRTVQRVVGDLVVDEAVSTAKNGRRFVYWVEDTTFSEATTSRSFPPPRARA